MPLRTSHGWQDYGATMEGRREHRDHMSHWFQATLSTFRATKTETLAQQNLRTTIIHALTTLRWSMS